MTRVQPRPLRRARRLTGREYMDRHEREHAAMRPIFDEMNRRASREILVKAIRKAARRG